MLSDSQQRLVKLLVSGCATSIVGFLLFLFLGGMGLLTLSAGPRGLVVPMLAGLGLMVFVIGLGMMGYGLVSGLKEAYSDNNKKPIMEAPGCYIIGKLILNKEQEQVFDPEMYEPDEITHLVQVALADGRRREFSTHPLIFQTIGEGARGTIYFQGNWLNKWVPEIGPASQNQSNMPPPDPFASGQL